MKSSIQCPNCGDFIDFQQTLPNQTIDDIHTLIGIAEADDFAPPQNQDLEDIKQRFLELGLLRE